ncbi:hypothetical protein CY34DRAFT_805284 [Suillus luteus UH-Slu-Lm8-n1]|uniref:Uncharacterized protein n=1 Tax=Suillus luteus UH-Slu-Lm8-n1 TaxID=930992 RepID=A0A0C9ZWF6_9AGAM|nr:hypothetical protein CY34DRAFT_805284 [Suillus luteus UH-Slu-Lm8-n1]
MRKTVENRLSDERLHSKLVMPHDHHLFNTNDIQPSKFQPQRDMINSPWHLAIADQLTESQLDNAVTICIEGYVACKTTFRRARGRQFSCVSMHFQPHLLMS